MAVTITLAEVAADRRLGDGTTDPLEPIAGVLRRYMETATALVQSYAPDAPVGVQNTSVSLIVGYLYDAPVADSTRYANALANSGAETLLYRWKNYRVAVVSNGGRQEPGRVSGLRPVGGETVNVVIAHQWVATSLPLPTAAVIGVQIQYPDGTTTGVELFANTLLTDTPVTPGDAANTQSEYAIGRTSGNLVALASHQTGRHTLTLWTVG